MHALLGQRDADHVDVLDVVGVHRDTDPDHARHDTSSTAPTTSR
ncbi:hypothetical protein [Rhodococcus opacus]|nr:hypothetical protein [Rhodococcus opacus]